MLPLRAITFEITSTLVCMSVPLGRVYGDAVRHFKLPCPADDVQMKDAFKVAYGRTNAELPFFGAPAQLSERDWWRRMIRSTLAEAGCNEAVADEETFDLVFRGTPALEARDVLRLPTRADVPRACSVAERIYSAFGSPDVWSPCPEGQRAMQHAKKRGLVVGVASNVYPRYVDANLPLLGLHRDLDFAVTSHALGQKKPSRAVFEAATRKAAHVHLLLGGGTSAVRDGGAAAAAPLEPEQVLHIGDDLQNDYLAARAAGLRALLFDPEGKYAAGGSSSSVEGLARADIICSLDEVPARIDVLLGVA
jgi:FMN phosphatase YigB (HAD superfamily)